MSFNATIVATATAAAHATGHELYANIDLTKLSWLEQMWAAWYMWIDNPIIATGLMSFLLHEVILLLHRVRGRSFNLVDCLLWTFHPLDYHRRYSIFPSVEAPT